MSIRGPFTGKVTASNVVFGDIQNRFVAINVEDALAELSTGYGVLGGVLQGSHHEIDHTWIEPAISPPYHTALGIKMPSASPDHDATIYALAIYGGQLKRLTYWHGIYLYGDSLSPTVANVTAYGIRGRFGAMNLANSPLVYGMYMNMPADYLAAPVVGAYIAGDGRTVSICTTDYALDISGAMLLNGAITGVNSMACDLGTSINEFSIDGTLVGNSDDAVPSEKAVKTYVDGVAGGAALFAFKTITGITNDVVADQIADTLTLASANNLLTIVGVSATDTITWTIVEGNFVLDGNILQIDGINSDGGAFAFTTTGAVTFNQDIISQGDITLNQNLIFAAMQIRTGADYIHIFPTTGNEVGKLCIMPSGTEDEAHIRIRNSITANWGAVFLCIDGLIADICSDQNGTGTAPTTFNINDADWDTINIGDATATINIGSTSITGGALSGITTLSMSGQLTNTLAIGTPPFVITSTTVVPNLNVDQVDGYDFDQALLQASSPTFVGLTLSGAIAGVTTLSMSGQLTNTLAIGTAPFVITSTDVVANLNVDMVDGYHLDQGVLIASTPTFGGLTINGAMTLNGAITGVNSIACDLGTGVNEFSIDGTLVGNSDDALPTEKAVKTYVDGVAGGASLYAFKTITGITNDVVADAIGDTLTFTSGNAILTIVGTTATDTITFTIDQAQISHDSIADVSADDHHKAPSDAAYGAGWNGVVDQAPTKNAVYDQLVTHYADADEHHAQSHAIVSHSDATLADPGADQMVFWDDSDSKFEFLVANTGLSIVGNNLNCDITQYTDGLARTACLEDDVYGAGWDADVTHAPTQNAVYDKINAMDILIAANTTVLEVEAVITAELVNGQSIDNAIDALINTHNVANRHIDHSAVSITAGVGLSGGGTIAASRTIDCDITQYTNAMAVAAVQAADPLALTNELTISGTGASSCAGDFHVLGDHELGSVQSVADPEGVVLQIDYSDANTSSRVFFREAQTNTYGASIIYAGAPNPVFDGTTFTLAGNKWYFITHSNSLTGTLAFSIARGATQVDFVGAIVCGGNLTAANIVTAGNVDGVDVSTFKTAYDTHVAAGDIHIAHSGVSVIAGTGLSGGGTIAASRTINCDITQYTDALAKAACVSDVVYGAGWDGVTTIAPSKNAVYDKIQTLVPTDYDADLVIGSGNATWINCPYEGASVTTDKFDLNAKLLPQSTGYYVYSIPLPTTRGGKSLYINGTRVSLSDADASNHVTMTRIVAYTDSGFSSRDTDYTDKNSVKLWTDLTMNTNLGGYHAAKIWVYASIASASNLDIQFITVRYYYA